MLTTEALRAAGEKCLPGLLGIELLTVSTERVEMELLVRTEIMAPNGFLHAGTLISLADSAAGYGCAISLPEGASGFTTIELKSNHLGTVREGTVYCVATPLHTGRTTQVWDAVVTDKESAKKLAVFRCTQMILYPK